MFGPGVEAKKAELWVPPGGIETLNSIGDRIGQPGMFSNAFHLNEYVDAEPFEAAGFEVTPERVLHYELLAFGFRAAANGMVLAYSGDSGPSDALPKLAADADLFLCEATLLAPNPEGGVRGHLAGDEAVQAFEASGAKRLLITHRPQERPLDAGLEQAYDGMEITVAEPIDGRAAAL
jgi:ribonuclease BN (tRNA processing enzyme)